MAAEIAIKSLAPILVVETVAPSLAFWVEKLGFAAGPCVPDEPPYQFAIVARDGIEVMLQTRTSVAEDVPEMRAAGVETILYLSVSSLEPILAAIGDAPVVVARRTTFYGADEIFVRDPAGHVIGFAASG